MVLGNMKIARFNLDNHAAFPCINNFQNSFPYSKINFKRKNFYIQRATALVMRITPISKKSMKNLTVQRVSPNQWRSYWGTAKIETLQKILESVLIAYGGAWMAWFLSFMAGSFVSSIIGTILVLNWMYSPWLFAHRMNNSVWKSRTSRNLSYGILSGKIVSVKKFRRKTGKTIGGISHEYFAIVIDDNQGRELEVITNWQDSYCNVKKNMNCSTILVSRDSDFSDIQIVTEVYVHESDTWVGEYPYLNRRKFIKFNDEIQNEPDNQENKETFFNNFSSQENYRIPSPN